MNRQALEYLKEWKTRQSRKPLVIRGARQVGKSYLIRQFAGLEFENLLEINFEQNKEAIPYFEKQEPQEILQLLSVHFDTAITEGKTLLFLDEIQAAPNIFAKLRYFYEKMPGLHVVAAGSLLEFLLKEHNFSMPVGRIEYLYLGPMTFMEFLAATGHQESASYLNSFTIRQELPAPLHKKLTGLFKQYLIIGGMPESIRVFVESGSYRESDRVKQSILTTYSDDFSKYGKRINNELVSTVFRALPKAVGTSVIYSHIARNYRSDEVSRAFHLLTLARVCFGVYHSSCEGIPLAATVNHKKMKPLFLDVGLLTGASGLSMTAIETAENLLLVNKGSITEQFIGQHLLYRQEPYREPELHFWAREKATANAEIDYAISVGTKIIGIEVKSGTTGSLKSLNQFIVDKKYPVAVRFNLDCPSICQSTGRMPAGDTYEYTLLSLPCYMVEQTERLLAGF